MRVGVDADVDVLRIGMAQRVRDRLGADPVHMRGDQRRQRGRAAGDGDLRLPVGRELVGALAQGVVEPAALQRRAQLGQARVHVRGGGLELDRGTRDDPLQRLADAAGERGDEQVRGVQALLGRVVQLPGDPAALGLDREPLALRALVREPAQRVAHVGERADQQRRQREVDRQRLGRDDLEVARRRAAPDRDEQERERRAEREPDGLAQRQIGRGQGERRRARACSTGCASRRTRSRARASPRSRSPTRRASAAAAATRRG